MPATVVEWQMRAWWSVLLVPERRTHLHSSYGLLVVVLGRADPGTVASGPLSLRISSSFFEISS